MILNISGNISILYIVNTVPIRQKTEVNDQQSDNAVRSERIIVQATF